LIPVRVSKSDAISFFYQWRGLHEAVQGLKSAEVSHDFRRESSMLWIWLHLCAQAMTTVITDNL
jgi:hypothetical protein